MRELGGCRRRQAAFVAEIPPTEKPGCYVQIGKVGVGLCVERIVDDEVENDKDCGDGNNAELPA